MATKRKIAKPSAYRLHQRGRQSIVTLTDPHTGRRRDVYLDEHGSDDSRNVYAQTLTKWETAGRVLDGKTAALRKSTE